MVEKEIVICLGLAKENDEDIITVSELKAIVADSTDFDDFKTKIAAL